MPSIHRALTLFFHLSLALVLFLGLVGCGSPSTPTRPPASPTSPATVRPPTAPVNLPTAQIPVLPTGIPLPTDTPAVIGPTAVITSTAATSASPSRPPATRTATPRPVVLAGRIAYSRYAGPTPREHTIWVANVDGSNAHQVLESAMWPAFSPDGKRLAYFQMSVGVTNPGLYIANSDGGNPGAVVRASGICCIDWSRDGNWIVYTNSPKPSQPTGPISMVKADGYYKTFVDLKVLGNDPSFSPDGLYIVFSGCMPGTNSCGVLVTRTDGNGVIRQITNDNGGNAHWSPQGNRIVYQAKDNADRHQVYVVNADGTGKKALTSGKSHDGQPIWSRDGGSILWRSDQNGTAWAIYAMNVDGSNLRKVIAEAPVDPVLWGWESMSVGP